MISLQKKVDFGQNISGDLFTWKMISKKGIVLLHCRTVEDRDAKIGKSIF